VDKKLKIVCVPLKSSKLLSAFWRIVKQGRFLTASLHQFSSRFFSKAERKSCSNHHSLFHHPPTKAGGY
jgi:hypothetical protein